MKRTLAYLAALALALLLARPATGADLLRATDALADAARAQGAAQRQADAWAAEAAALRADIRRERELLRWQEAAAARRERYAKEREAAVRALTASARDMAALERDLEPALDAILERLEAFVAADLAFLPEERAQRLATLRAALGDYGMAPGEKLRLFLEALQVEAAYGAAAETRDAQIELGGTALRGRELRLGRVVALFVSHDGRRAARLSPGAAGWEALPDGETGALRAALEMLEHRKAFELLALPVGEVRP